MTHPFPALHAQTLRERIRFAGGAVLIAVLYGVSAYFLIRLTEDTGRVSAFWVGNALVVGMIFGRGLYCKALALGFCFLANIIANLALGDPAKMAIGLGFANLAEMALLLFALGKIFHQREPLSKTPDLAILALLGLIVPILPGTIEGILLSIWDTNSFWSGLGNWLVSHSLAIPIFTAMIFTLRGFGENSERRSTIPTIHWLYVVSALAISIPLLFAQQSFPFLFLATPVVVLAAFFTGRVGTAVTVAVFACAISLASLLGYGTIALAREGAREELIALQTFMAACISVGIPVAMALNNRATIRAELKESRDFIATILDGVSDVVFRTDDQWRWTYLNRRWEALTNRRSEDEIGQAALRHLVPEDLPGFEEWKKDIAAGSATDTQKILRLETESRMILHLAITATPVFDESGTFTGVIGRITDVTQEVAKNHALEESESRFRRLAEASPVAMFQADANGKLTYANAIWLSRFGIHPDTMMGDGWKDHLSTGEELEGDPAFTGFKKPGDVRRRVLCFKDSDGKDFWCETVNAAEFDQAGNIVGFVGIAHDITEQRMAMHRLQASEKRFATLANMAPAGIFRTDGMGECTYVNQAWKDLSGLADGEWEGTGWARALHPDDAERVSEKWVSCVTAGEEASDEFRWLRADGSIVWVHVVYGPETDDTGKISGYIGVVSDITENRLAREQLAEREEQLALLADNATDAVLRLDLDGICKYASPSARQIFGIEHNHLIGNQLITGFHEKDAGEVVQAFARLARGHAEQIRIPFRSESLLEPGTYKWLEANCGLVRDPETQEPLEIIASLRNVDETKRLEAELVDAKNAAESAVAAKSAFLANMSHEIRTPMNGVIGFTELALAGELPEDLRAHLQMIADSGRSMLRLLNDLLDLAQIESGRMSIVSEPTDIRHKLRGVVRLMEPVARQKNIILALDIDDTIPVWLMSDRMRLRQIVLNLLGNALKFTEHGSVSIRVRTVGNNGTERLQISVSDTGIGIAADQMEGIFDKFTQADASIQRRFGGTGLGLPISKQLTEMMGGTLTANSVEGRGSTFLLTLPFKPCASPAKDNSVKDRREKLETASQNLRVLCAEDNEINQRLTLAMLAKAGYTADLAEDGAIAVDMVRKAASNGSPYDIVLMDMQMPNLDGLEATRMLRAQGFSENRLPIIALTANAFADDVAACYAAGMQAHLAKPLRLRDLVTMIQTFTPARNQTSASTTSDLEQETDPRLGAMFAERKQEALQAIEAAIRQGSFDGDTLEDLAHLLHQIAGVAAYFGDSTLGEKSSEIENKLTRSSPDEAADLLDQMQALLAA